MKYSKLDRLTINWKDSLLMLFIFLMPYLVYAQNKSKRPNFIQILTDDQGWGDLASFGHQFMITPNIDKLAAEGIKFTNCYSAAAVCSPSRSAILTGRTPYRNGVYRFIPDNHFCHLPAKEVTLPQLLRTSGYQTAHFGKWHLSYFDEKKIKGDHAYADFKFGKEDQPTMKDYGYDYYFATGNVARPNHQNPLNFFLNGKPMGEMKGFSAQIVAEQFRKWLLETRAKNEPFFITIWFNEPHGPVNSDPKFLNLYKNSKAKLDSSMVQYMANVTQLDEAVGTVVKSLKEIGEYENTLIWYSSDNGPEGASEHGSFNTSDSPYGPSRYRGETGGLRGRKRFTHEGGVRVPGIISWPEGLKNYGVKPGNVSGVPIIGSDVFPTLLELASVKIPTKNVLDGASIVPVLEGKSFTRPRPLYWRNGSAIGLRDGIWKMVGDPMRKHFALYNLSIDTRETTDLAAYEPAVYERMKNALINYDKEVLLEGPDWYKRDAKSNKNMPN